MTQTIINKRWIKKKDPDWSIVDSLSESLKINKFLATIIAQRGISNFEMAKHFFNPEQNDLHDPFLMKGMKKAVERIVESIKQNEKILIYGDYDVDGTTSVALTYNYFIKITSNLVTYVPDRFKEGYGISKQSIDYAIQEDVNLIIALDCGIKDISTIKYATENQIEVIVCDHHTPGTELPPAFSILNPKQKDCNYPYKELSGCGIGFKLIQAYSIHTKNNIDPLDFVDLVAVSIASDIVPMIGENRVLTFLGLQKLNNDPGIPFRAMMNQLEIEKELLVSDLVFIFGPRLNASGRISHAKNTVKFLISKNIQEASQQVNQINEQNNARKELDQSIADEALQMIEDDEILRNRKSTVLWDPTWHKGVIGIVASRLLDSYYRPTIILTESEGKLSGSARSVSGFDLPVVMLPEYS